MFYFFNLYFVDIHYSQKFGNNMIKMFWWFKHDLKNIKN